MKKLEIFNLKNYSCINYLTKTPKPIKFLIDNLIPLGIAGTLYGSGGVGKTIASLILGIYVSLAEAFELDWFGKFRIKTGGKVIYFTSEDPNDVVHHRVHHLYKNFLKDNANIKNNTCYNRSTGKRISACVPMHTFGHPCRIDKIVEICEHYHIAVVEDSAESLGSKYKGKHTGTIGKLGIFSFNGNKTVTCGGGGAIVTDDEKIAKIAKHLTTTAKVSHPYEYMHDAIGYNYRMPNLNAALACAQLEQLDRFIENKRELARKYADFFKEIKIEFITETQEARSNYWLNTILLPDFNARNEFLEATNAAGVMTRPAWKLLNTLEMYKYCQTDDLKNARWLEERVVNIPSSVQL